MWGVIRTIEGGVDALGRKAEDSCAVTLINRSARTADIYLTSEDLMGVAEIVSDRDETHSVRAGAFCVKLAGMHGVTYFAQKA